MTAPPAVLPVPRPKTTKDYDQRTTEQAFQALERDLAEKYDKRSDLILDPGKELVLTADNSSAMYGIGIDNSGYLRILDYSDGTIGTFSVAWSNVDGAAQEITNLTTYVDAADATLQASINTNASTSATNGTAISVLQTEITAAREGEASLLANITDVRTAFASADAAEASARATLQANLEAADTTLQANIDAEESARVTADAAEASARTTLQANLEAADTTLQASIDSEEAARVAADVAEAAARTTLTAQVRGVEAPLVKNAYFQEEFSGTAAPPEWSIWNGTAGTWVTRTYGEGYAYSVAAGAGSSSGIRQTVSAEPNKKYLLSGEVVRTLGGSTLAGSGVLVQWFNSGGTYLAQHFIAFATEATTSGVIDSAPDGVTRWEKEVTAPATAVTGRVYAMNHWSTLGSVAAALTLTWRECNLVPVSNAQAQSTINAASISTNATAIANETSARAAADTTLTASVGTNTSSINNLSEAYATDSSGTARLVWTVAVGTNVATLEQTAATGYSDGTWNGSAISLTASEIILDGAVLTTGTVARTALSSAERDALGAEGVAANFYRQSSDPGSVPDGSWWADTGNSELNIRISSAWQKIADIGGDQFRASGTSYLTAEVSGSGSGTATTSAPSITVSGDVGTLTYLWRQKSTDALVSCSNTAIINPTFSRTMSAAPTSAVQTLWTLYITDATLGETIQWDVIVNFTNSF